MTNVPPWSPPDAPPPPEWSPDEPPPPQGPPYGPPGRSPSSPRGIVVGLVLVAVIVLLGVTSVFLVGTRGDDPSRAPLPARGESDGRHGLTPPKVPEGYDLFLDHDGSFAFVVPAGWETALLDDASVRRARDRLEDDNPPVAFALVQVDKSVGDRGLAFAAERDDQDGFVANLSLLLAPRSVSSLEQIASEGRAELERLGATVGPPRAVTVGDRAGLVVDVVIDSPLGPIAEQQLYVASGYRVYALTLAGVSPETADTIIGSLRVP